MLNLSVAVHSSLAFWKSFQNWWTNKTKQQLALSDSMILYGVFDKTEHKYSLNYVLLIAKFSICCSSLLDEKLSFDSFLILLKEKKKYKKKLHLKTSLLLLSKNPFNILFNVHR